MKTKFLLLISTLILSSCGTIQVVVNSNSSYSRKIPITINLASNDESGTLGELQYLLKSNGYKLMSYSSAKKALNLDSQHGNNSSHSELTYTHEFNSIYLMEVDYSYYLDLFIYNYTNFSATITDLRTGEIIMTAMFRGDRSCRGVLQEFVEKLNTVIK